MSRKTRKIWKMNFKELSVEELFNWVKEKGLEKYRAEQLLYWLYKKPAKTFSEMSNLPAALRKELEENFSLFSLKEVETIKSADQTEKKLFITEDGEFVESVIIPDKDRLTLCISTQIGCRMGCRFCLTGYQGFKRNLRTCEILDQILLVKLQGYPITNIVIMGMGEPLDNFENTTKALKLMFDERALGLSYRKVTLSTIGIIPELEELLKTFPKLALSLSLNAPDGEKRAEIMPMEKRYPIKEILAILRKYQKNRRKMFTMEYVLLKGFNDSEDDARKLTGLLKGLRCKINLIPFNPWPGSPFERPEEERVLRFQEILIEKGYSTFIRKSKGKDILAACGQLRWKKQLNPEGSAN